MNGKWKTETRRLGDLKPWGPNPRRLSNDEAIRLRTSIAKFGYSQLYEIEPDNTILDGHQREEIMLMMDQFGADAEIEVRVSPRKLTEDERKEYILAKVKAGGGWHWEKMGEIFKFEELKGWGFDDDELLKHGFSPDKSPEDYSDFEAEIQELEGYQEVDIVITVPQMYSGQVSEWLANGETNTAPGLGKGVLKRCGLL